MIQASELRIGNWVTYHGETDMPCQLDAQDIYNIAIGWMNNEKIHSPILLTAEVMDKCGFEKYLYNKNKTAYTQHWVSGFLNPDNMFCLIGHDGRHVNIKYLHQLQNLYHALSGQELIYTP